MGQPITPVSITAPGVFGLNTQDSPVDMDPKYALDARNCVIDKSGRIASRKGWVAQNTTAASLGSNYIEALGELVRNDGTTTLLAAGNNKLFKLVSTTLTELTYGGGGAAPTITANDWQIVTMNDIAIFVQRGYDPLIYDPAVSTTTYRRLSEKAGALGTIPKAHCALSAFGRLWVANTDTDRQTIAWSDTLAPQVMSTGTSGTLDVRLIWPRGGDEVMALAAHNGNLLIFGKQQILIYTGADDPTTMRLLDTVHEIGCVSRNTVQNTGDDVVFLSPSGVRTLSRTIQEKSAPIKAISRNIENDLQGYLSEATEGQVKSTYSPGNAFYLLSFLTNKITFCIDLRTFLPDGSGRVTMWTGIAPKAMCSAVNGTLYTGQAGYIGKYEGYNDGGASFRLVYASPWIDFGNPMRLSILKKLTMYLTTGRNQTFVFKYGIDYVSGVGSFTELINNAPASEYGISEYGTDEYGTGASGPISVNIGGSGRVIQVAVETQLTDRQVALQRVDIYTKEGRI